MPTARVTSATRLNSGARSRRLKVCCNLRFLWFLWVPPVPLVPEVPEVPLVPLVPKRVLWFLWFDGVPVQNVPYICTTHLMFTPLPADIPFWPHAPACSRARL